MNSKDKEKIFSRALGRAGIPHGHAEMYYTEVVHRGPYTFCAVIASTSIFLPGLPRVATGHGFSKCSPRDKFNPDIGFAIALSRAATDAAKKLAEEFGNEQNKKGKQGAGL